MRVGIFDSGLGGINVLSCLIKKYPHNEYIYFGDTKNIPYGDKRKDELMHLACKAIDFLLSKKVDIIIIACGTISSTCLVDLKKKYHFPLYDVISPTKKYLSRHKFDNIGVIGTSRTIESKIFNIENKNIIMKATPTFVPIIEEDKILENKKNILEELKIFKDCDVLVLGCTHYPLLKDLIETNLKIKTIDMGICLLDELNLTNDSQLKIELYFSLLNPILISNVNKIIQEKHQIKQK